MKFCCRKCGLDECYYYLTDCDYCEECPKDKEKCMKQKDTTLMDKVIKAVMK